MLGRPEVDPHGDPIPNADGQVKPQESQTLMTCPIGAPVRVTRVVDQDSAFLRFVDRHHLKPGAAIQVEERDASADSVRVRGEDDTLITIGTRAASKLLVQVARTALLLLLAALPAWAQDTPQPATPAASRAPRTNLSGYMDFHYNKPQFTDGSLDFHRFVLLVTHSFSDRIRFVSEVEIEHALVEGGEEKGELELEQAYVDFLLSRRFNVRAGMMLMPIGIINERHEPPVYLRRRAAVRGHRDRPHHMVRDRSRHPRRGRTRLALPRVRDGPAQRRGVQRGRGHPRRQAEGVAGQRGSCGDVGPPGIRGAARPHGGRQLVGGPVGIRVPAAIRRARDAR